MLNTLETLTQLLKKDQRLIIDGNLAKNKIIELALKFDKELLKLLLSSPEIKKIFFQEVDNILVFDKIKFQSFVSNKQFLPDSFTKYKNKIGLTANGQYLADSKEVVLAWPYKDCILEGGQTKEDAKRHEIFWNETLAPDEIDRLLTPKVLTNFQKYDKGKETALSLSLSLIT
ncbi:MAG: Type III restriction-modification system methylation subunit [Mycoplasmataceae bacterium RV_VA103A]|nr:MAG: Type III restriction-modification system methylation subunit [Mycoplasmataceae bacterium RV_VA103A]KLL05041.1 MAG: Type III restriction-modification system methylation subunit [Mycoplasmataceae bacterium RV_VA103A]